MPASDFFEAMVYEQLEPFGDRRGDIQAGIVASTLANIHRGPGRPLYKLTDFIPEWEPRPERIQTAEEQLHLMLLLQQVQNARVQA